MKLQANNLSVGYGEKRIVFPEISFAAGEGDMIALLGVNGIGKSTLLRTLAGLQKSVSGVVLIGGKNLENISVSERAQLVSIVLTERIFIDNIRARDFIALGRSPYTSWLGALSADDEAEIEKVIEVMFLQTLQHRYFNELSDGERQRVLIARALCQQTPVLILDEPTAFLDFRNKREILKTLKHISSELNKTVLFSTHDIETALEYCNKCWIMTEQKEFSEVKRTENFGNEVRAKLSIPLAG